jgi:hypothetical protein
MSNTLGTITTGVVMLVQRAKVNKNFLPLGK